MALARLVTSTGSVDLTLRRRSTRTRDIAVGPVGTGDSATAVGDRLEQPRTVRLPVIYTGSDAGAAAFYRTLVQALRDAVRIEVDVGATTYTRALHPGGRVSEPSLGNRRFECTLELYPTSATWQDSGGQEVMIWW